MSPVPAAQPTRDPRTGRHKKLFTWDDIFARAPRMASTMVRYLDQLRVSARASTLSAYDDALRMFAGHITLADLACTSVAAIEHRHIEAHKMWMASRPGRSGGPMSPTTISHRLCLLHTFFERIIDWDYDDAPRRCPIYKGDFPERDEPLPKFPVSVCSLASEVRLVWPPPAAKRLAVGALAPWPGGCRCAEGGRPDPCHRDHPVRPRVKLERPQAASSPPGPSHGPGSTCRRRAGP
jgi:hypothetical protein